MINARFIRIWLPVLMVILMFASSASAEWKEKVLYSFQGGSDGQSPAGGVVFDKTGNLYGATYEGGSTCPSPGCGTIFQLSPGNGGTWTETILYEFNGNQGSYPEGGVIADANGNLFGTTAYGGSGICLLFGDNVGCGVAYELSPPAKKGGQWTYTILYNFQGGKDGQIPQGNLTFDKAGNLYGATLYGGGYGSCNAPYFQHCGTVFKLSVPKQKGGKWTEQIMYSFKSGTDGANPNGGLVLDSSGAVYGTTFSGGSQGCNGDGYLGCGTVFKLAKPTRKGGNWTKSILHRFNGQDGGGPDAGVIFDKANDLYGTTVGGGGTGLGVAFELKPPSGKPHAWTETVLYKFTDGNDGAYPMAGLTFDAHGNLYGTASVGGYESDHGVVFELRPPAGKRRAWAFSPLYGFGNGTNGWAPAASVTLGKAGGLYSTTQAGGVGTGCNNGCGTVFEVSF
jgi:uncharacterized repeat protein (TIGR03803 family)